MTDVLVATRKGVFELDGPQLRVKRAHFLGVAASAVLHDPRDGAWYVALDHGHFGVKMHRSDDQGDTWTEIGAPAYPPKPEGFVDICPMRQIERPWNTEMIWTLEAGHVDEPGVLWAGTIPGGLFRSTDRGETWELNRPLWDHPARMQWMGGGYDYPGVHSVLVDPRAPGHVVVGVSCGGAWRSEDAGATWTISHGMTANFLPPDIAATPEIQDPHRLASPAANPDVVWVQHHGGVFVSRDGGLTYSEVCDIAPSAFGFAVAAHPLDANTAWFVPASSDEVRIPVEGRVVVNKTTDGGQTFRTITAGLPQEHAYDLVYRHALDVDATGERLAFGSTTGSLWVSNDGGESFVAAHTSLPPVAYVRWV